MPALEGGQERRAVRQSALNSDRPPRRRRSALLAGALLVASSPFTVGAGMFVPGFAALGIGALLLLLPPVAPRERRRRRPWRVLRTSLGLAGRGAVALARGTAGISLRASRAVAGWAATSGRDGALRICWGALDGLGALGRFAAAARARVWAVVEVIAPRVRRTLDLAGRSLAGEARAAWRRASTGSRPALRRASAALAAGGRRAARELAVLTHTTTERLSAYIDSRTGPR